MNNRFHPMAFVFLILCCLSGCGSTQDSEENAMRFMEAERKTPSIGANGRLTAGADGTVLFCDAQGGIYQTKDVGVSWEKFGKGRQRKQLSCWL